MKDPTLSLYQHIMLDPKELNIGKKLTETPKKETLIMWIGLN